MMHVTFRPISEWPEENFGPNEPGEASSFRSNFSRTLEVLEYELMRLGADSVVISLALSDEEIRRDGWPKQNARPRHPGVILEFQDEDGRWQRYISAGYTNWRHNLHDIALTLEGLRALGRRNAVQGQQYQGFRKELPSAWPMTTGEINEVSTRYEAISFLREQASMIILFDTPDPLDVQQAYRIAAKKLHPDAGGEPGMFEKLQKARDILLDEKGHSR